MTKSQSVAALVVSLLLVGCGSGGRLTSPTAGKTGKGGSTGSAGNVGTGGNRGTGGSTEAGADAATGDGANDVPANRDALATDAPMGGAGAGELAATGGNSGGHPQGGAGPLPGTGGRAVLDGGGTDRSAGEAGPTMVDGHADAREVAAPFVPAALEDVMNNLVAAVEAKRLSSSQKPPIAVLLQQLDGPSAPIVVGANRMAVRLATPTIVAAPLIVNPEDGTAAQTLQNQYLQAYVTSGIYRGLAITPFVENEETVALVDQFIVDAGPVVTVDVDLPDSGRSYLITTDSYGAGVATARKLAEALRPGDAVVVFGTNLAGWPSGLERARGAEEAAAAAGLVVAPRISPTWDSGVDSAQLVAALTDPAAVIRGLICVHTASEVCAAAVEAAGLKGKVRIVGSDMTAATKVYFDKGYFDGVVVARPYYVGQLSLLVPYAIAVLGAAQTAAMLQPILATSTVVDTGVDILTPDNYASYVAYLSSLGINP